MPVPKEMNGKSGSMGADAFQQLARYVRDVRVAEHQQIEGKSVTTILVRMHPDIRRDLALLGQT